MKVICLICKEEIEVGATRAAVRFSMEEGAHYDCLIKEVVRLKTLVNGITENGALRDTVKKATQ